MPERFSAARKRLGKMLWPVLALCAGFVFAAPAVPSGAVVGGTPVASLSDTPFIGYFAAVRYPSWDFLHFTSPARENCGATLISPGYALTAAHCVTDEKMAASNITLAFGRARRSDSGGEKRGVTSVILAPGSAPHAHLYDLAVLKLSKPITDYALPLMGSGCPDWSTRSPMFAIGWGQSGKLKDDKKPPLDQVQRASLLFDGTAPDLYSDRYFWAVDPADVMQYGDSGSGLFFQRPDGRYEMLGVLHDFLTRGADWDGTPTRQSVFERTDAGSGNWGFLQNYVAGSAPCPAAPPAAPASPDTLYPGQQLDPGSQLSSADGRYTLVMQTDGNLVEYVADQPVWASGTYDPGSVLQAQADGNVVIYGPGHVAVWATNTDQPGSVLVVQDDGNIVVYAPGHTPVWATGTNEAEV